MTGGHSFIIQVSTECLDYILKEIMCEMQTVKYIELRNDEHDIQNSQFQIWFVQLLLIYFTSQHPFTNTKYIIITSNSNITQYIIIY